MGFQILVRRSAGVNFFGIIGIRYHFEVNYMKPLNKIKTVWSPSFAYAVGLLVTDGNLSNNGRHINFTSKDKQLAELFVKCLGIKNKIGMKSSGSTKEKKYCFVQFGDVDFYKFLEEIGLTQNKSKILQGIKIPSKYFFHFLRGHFDGDGIFYSYWDTRWKSSFMFYTVFLSASQKHILWIQDQIKVRLGINGHITKSEKQACYQLKYAKEESFKLLPKLYHHGNRLCLSRKYLKIKRALAIIDKRI